MARISAKRLLEEEQQKRKEEYILGKNTIECANFLMQRMGLEVDNMGYVARYDEDTDELSELVFDGKKCKDINSYIDPRKEMGFDPYNNIKLCCGLLQYYVNFYLRRDTNMIYLSNKTTNDIGSLTLVFENGEKLTGYEYNKDTLKYIDMIVLLDGATPVDHRMLKGMDIDGDTVKR